MTKTPERHDVPGEPFGRPPLRLWPGVAIVVVQSLAWFVLPSVMPQAGLVAVAGGVLGGVAIVVWWALFSRAAVAERLGAIFLMVVALAATPRFVDESVATAGMGALFYIYAIPILSVAFVVWAVATRRMTDGMRRATMVVTIVAACGVWALVRIGGITNSLDTDFSWRWAQTPEERMLEQTADEPATVPSAPAIADTGVGWPGFRGPDRNSVIPGVRIDTDWSASPPVELWRRPIGPGWSSFAVRGDVLYTQEQRGDNETVAAYNVTTGEPVWRHADAVRFWEANAGAGPRGTPTLRGDRVYAFGATGILNALDADDGSVVWSRDVASDTGKEVPYWGFASSPLVVGDLVVIAAAGQLAAYDLATGDPRWRGPDGGGGYSSPHLLTVDGVTQILLVSGTGVTSVTPADGTLLWEHPWSGTPIVQPTLLADGDLLISVTGASAGFGIRRLSVARGPGGWTIREHWTSRGLKPYFSDFVVHRGHAYGFDGSILSSIELENGERAWKGGRYGEGQLVLLPDQDLLLVVSEGGELALVAAAPDQFREIARFPALDGKTWNHPVLAGDLLLVRNAEEMVAFRLPLAGR